MTANEKFEKVMHEYGKGKLYSGKHKVTHPDQALAIAFSEAKKINPKFGAPKKNVGGLFSEQIGITDEEAIFWWDEVLSEKKKIEFVDYAISTLKDPNIGLRRNDYLILTETKYKEFPVEIRNQIKTWLYSVPSKELKAGEGIKLKGPSHDEGGIPGKIKESEQPIEVEGGEVIINKRSMKIKEHITCKGTPEGIASRINEIDGNGIRFSEQSATCKFNKGNKLKTSRRRPTEEEINKAIKEKNSHDAFSIIENIVDRGEGDFASIYFSEWNRDSEDELEAWKWGTDSIKRKIINDYVKASFKEDAYLGVLNNPDREMAKKGKKIRSHVGPSKIEKMIIRDNELVNKAEEGIKVSDSYIKINEPEVYEILRFTDSGHPTDRAITYFNWKGNDIAIFRNTPALIEFLDKYGIHYTVFDNKIELFDFLTERFISERRLKGLGLIK